MKEYLKQIYTEGFGRIFYLKPVSYLKKKIKNKYILKLLVILIGIIYSLLIILLVGLILRDKLK